MVPWKSEKIIILGFRDWADTGTKSLRSTKGEWEIADGMVAIGLRQFKL